jgi:Obg family GTPase CgtA
VQVPVGTVVHLVSGSIPSLEPPPVTPDTTKWERSKVSGDTEGTSATTKEESPEISAAWLDNLFLDNAKARLLAEKTQSMTDSTVGMAQPDDRSETDDHLVTDESEVQEEDIAGESNSYFPSRNFEKPDPQIPALVAYSKANIVTMAGDAHDEEEHEDEDEEEADELSEVVPRRNNNVTKYAVAEFVKPGQSLVMGTGGEGGRGNASIARGVGKNKSLPSFEHEGGLPGSEAVLVLELKTIADVGLVGAPNAGKSTLLGAISRAKPTVGHYAFTTLRPNIGKLEYDDHFALTVADIPGLIKGAHENRGLGHAFLRHIERTKALAYVVDLSAGDKKKSPLPWDQLQELKFELEKYEAGLSARPALVVANKIDEPGTEQALAELRRRVGEEMPIFPVCAVLEEGVDELRLGLRMLVDEKDTLSSRNTAWMRSKP